MAQLTENITPKSFENVLCRRIQYNIEGAANLGTKDTELEWKDYCPEAFRNIQELDQVSQADYSMVLYASDILKEVTYPAKPGRIFFASADELLVVKTLRKVELKGILEMFPSYYFHLSKNPSSLLIRLYGLHSVRQLGGLKVYFLVLGNIIPAGVSFADRYHLKGISTGRKSQILKVEDYVFQKDFDFGYRFYLHPLIREKLLAQIKADCSYLEEDDRTDYCIVLCVSRPWSSRSPYRKSNLWRPVSSCKSDSQESGDTQWRFSDTAKFLDRNECRFGRGMAVRAVRRKATETGILKETKSFNAVLNFIITDYFQKYNMKKRIEHLYKSIQHDTKLVSTVNPKDYCSRFLDFVEQIFLPEE